MNTLLLRRALEWCLMLGTPIALHEEDPYLCAGGAMNESAQASKLGFQGMPRCAEDLMIARDIELARVTKGRIHFCHVSTARSVELIRRAKNDGVPITAEATPHHLFLTEREIFEHDTNAKMNPPLRSDEDLEALHLGVKDGTIDCIASDHAPHELDKKRIEFPLAAFGIIGLQSTLPLVLELVRQGILNRMRAVEALTCGASKIYGLGLGKLAKGSAADITIVDPEFEWEFTKDLNCSLSVNSPFFGRTFKGKAESVIIGGNFVMRNGAL
ncbi:MAG: dihydroorotase [SAR324 cluster bacterium]|uniref:Dihydroorotase n=1 Tax=SAR324 cluster bacterium TaxID=2024889 RepID=A0A7X9FQB5_9DELT|nr:dihydroorotase [SAR324 cluster bacterium]